MAGGAVSDYCFFVPFLLDFPTIFISDEEEWWYERGWMILSVVFPERGT